MFIKILGIWLLIGMGITIYGLRQKKKYGYRTPYSLQNLPIIIVSIIIWPLTVKEILNLIKREEAAIQEAIKQNSKLTREKILRGAKKWRDLTK